MMSTWDWLGPKRLMPSSSTLTLLQVAQALDQSAAVSYQQNAVGLVEAHC